MVPRLGAHLSISSPIARLHIEEALTIQGREAATEAYPPAMKLLACLLLVSFSAAAYASRGGGAVVAGGSGSLGSDPEDTCVYTVYVRTGSIWKGGTDSAIGVTLRGADGSGVRVDDLAKWGGMMGSGHDYYERGNLDIFSGRGPCMSKPPCWMNLTSDGAGAHHGWYSNYLEVTATGPHMGCHQQLFTVEQWLATDASPYRLYAVRDACPKASSSSGSVPAVEARVNAQ